jgi:hypothetical protein
MSVLASYNQPQYSGIQPYGVASSLPISNANVSFASNANLSSDPYASLSLAPSIPQLPIQPSGTTMASMPQMGLASPGPLPATPLGPVNSTQGNMPTSNKFEKLALTGNATVDAEIQKYNKTAQAVLNKTAQLEKKLKKAKDYSKH